MRTLRFIAGIVGFILDSFTSEPPQRVILDLTDDEIDEQMRRGEMLANALRNAVG